MMPPKLFWRHVGDGTHQHAASGTALRDDAVMAGEPFRDEMVGRGDEIGEGVLLLQALAVFVPVIAFVLAAANMGDGIDEAAIGEGQAIGVEACRNGDAIGAIAIKQAWRRTIDLRVAMIDDGDGHDLAIRSGASRRRVT